MARDLHLRTLLRSEYAGRGTDRAGCAEHEHAPALQRTARNARRKIFSTQATAAAAVVNAPLGSTSTDTSNGGTIAFLAASNICSAVLRSRPPMNRPVRFTPLGPREKIASCVSVVHVGQRDAGIGHDGVIARVVSHVHIERARLRGGSEEMQNMRFFHRIISHDWIDGRHSGHVRRPGPLRSALRDDGRDCVR